MKSTKTETLQTRFLDYFNEIKESLRHDFDSWTFDSDKQQEPKDKDSSLSGFLVNLESKTVSSVFTRKMSATDVRRMTYSYQEDDSTYPLNNRYSLIPGEIWDGLFIRTEFLDEGTDLVMSLDSDEFFEFCNYTKELLPLLDYLTVKQDDFKKIIPIYGAITALSIYEEPRFLTTLFDAGCRTKESKTVYSLKDAHFFNVKDGSFKPVAEEILKEALRRADLSSRVKQIIAESGADDIFKLLPELLENPWFVGYLPYGGFADGLTRGASLDLLQGENGLKLFQKIREDEQFIYHTLFVDSMGNIVDKERAETIFNLLEVDTIPVVYNSTLLESYVEGLERIPSITIVAGIKTSDAFRLRLADVMRLLQMEKEYQNVKLSDTLKDALKEFREFLKDF